MLAGAILVIISILVGEFVAPVTERMAQLIKVSAQNKQVLMNAKYGLWLREGKKFINVRQIVDDGNLEDISIYELMINSICTRRCTLIRRFFWVISNGTLKASGNQRYRLNKCLQAL